MYAAVLLSPTDPSEITARSETSRIAFSLRLSTPPDVLHASDVLRSHWCTLLCIRAQSSFAAVWTVPAQIVSHCYRRCQESKRGPTVRHRVLYVGRDLEQAWYLLSAPSPLACLPSLAIPVTKANFLPLILTRWQLQRRHQLM